MTVGAIIVNRQGVGEVNADALNTFIQGALSDTQLQNTVGVVGMIAASQGSTSPGIGTLRFYYWSATATGGVNTIIPTGAASGGWVKLTLG